MTRQGHRLGFVIRYATGYTSLLGKAIPQTLRLSRGQGYFSCILQWVGMETVLYFHEELLLGSLVQ